MIFFLPQLFGGHFENWQWSDYIFQIGDFRILRGISYKNEDVSIFY